MVIKSTASASRIFGLLAIGASVSAQIPKASPTIEAQLPGYSIPVSGRWLGPSQNQSGVPLGGIGTGFVELRPDGLIHDTVLHNNWRKPAPVPGCGLTFWAQNETTGLISTAAAVSGSLRPTPRYFGHYPIA